MQFVHLMGNDGSCFSLSEDYLHHIWTCITFFFHERDVNCSPSTSKLKHRKCAAADKIFVNVELLCANKLLDYKFVLYVTDSKRLYIHG